MSHAVPDKPALEGLEARYAAVWEREGVYRFPGTAGGRDAVYSIDTPPPTASGSLHIGHVFSYTHTDLLARYHRMRGKSVFYPMGWDDNGLPTERRVQNYYGVRCDPTLPYDPGFLPPAEGTAKSTRAADQRPISRRNFIELCERLTEEDEQQFEAVFRRIGLSVDWRQTYRTIGDDARAASQRAFLEDLEHGRAYQADAPSLWDVTFRTAVAQAELEDREQPGAYHAIAFAGPDGDVAIESTRPELLPACVALVAHPDDARYAALVGQVVRSPVFGVDVPVVAHHLAQPDKGTGIAMVCTFGDLNDVTWWRDLSLPNRAIIGFDGRIVPEPPAAIDSAVGRAAFAELAGKTVFSARAATVELLRDRGRAARRAEADHPPGEVLREGRPAARDRLDPPVVHHERRAGRGPPRAARRGRQGAAVRARLHAGPVRELGRGADRRLAGLPSAVLRRADPRVVPRGRRREPPVRRRAPAGRRSAACRPLLRRATRLHGGPAQQARRVRRRAGHPGHLGDLVADPAAGRPLGERPGAVGCGLAVRPAPAGQDIIRTWLFSTLLRSELEFGQLPWKTATISGFIVDPDRKKMSKSKGNVVTPADILQQHGSDAVRYWAASSRLGMDAALDAKNPTQMRKGRKLAIKVLNAAKFIEGFDPADGAPITEPLDLAMLAALDDVVRQATTAFEADDHARALEAVEPFFWTFCDDHLELVKDRAYGSGPARDSAVAALRLALDTLLKLLAPVLPFATEEAWRWSHDGSVHVQRWPEALGLGGDAMLLPAAGEALIGIRRAKTDAKVSQRTPVASVTISGPEALVRRIELVAGDLGAAGRIGSMAFEVRGEVVEVAGVTFVDEQGATDEQGETG